MSQEPSSRAVLLKLQGMQRALEGSLNVFPEALIGQVWAGPEGAAFLSFPADADAAGPASILHAPHPHPTYSAP